MNIEGQADKIDELLENSGLDPEEWESVKATIHVQATKEGQPYKQIWAKVKRKETAPFMNEDWKTEFLSKIRDIAPAEVELPKREYKLLSKINLSDAHLRMLSWHKETGVNYDLDIGAQKTLEAGMDLLERSVDNGVERVLLVIGNDMFHSDSQEPFTKRSGNLLDVDSRYQKGFEKATELIIQIVDRALTEFELPVDITPIPGNHDYETVYFLGQFLHAYYHNQEHVNVDVSPKPRKYYRWGKCLLGDEHGDRTKKKQIPNIMSQENPEISWADCPFREMHFGHTHHERSEDLNGTVLRWTNAIAPEDLYHYSEGYVGSVKGSQAFVYDKELGLRTILMHRINYRNE